jgi:hypothetical protein
MEMVLEFHLFLAMKMRKKMVYFVTRNAVMVTKVLGLYVGLYVHQAILILVHFVVPEVTIKFSKKKF